MPSTSAPCSARTSRRRSPTSGPSSPRPAPRPARRRPPERAASPDSWGRSLRPQQGDLLDRLIDHADPGVGLTELIVCFVEVFIRFFQPGDRLIDLALGRLQAIGGPGDTV